MLALSPPILWLLVSSNNAGSPNLLPKLETLEDKLEGKHIKTNPWVPDILTRN